MDRSAKNPKLRLRAASSIGMGPGYCSACSQSQPPVLLAPSTSFPLPGVVFGDDAVEGSGLDAERAELSGKGQTFFVGGAVQEPAGEFLDVSGKAMDGVITLS